MTLQDAAKFAKPSWLWEGALALGLSVVFTLYLAPTPEKYEKGDWLALMLLLPILLKYGAGWSQWRECIRTLAPLFLLMGFLGLQAWMGPADPDANLRYIFRLGCGLLPFILLFLVFRHTRKTDVPALLIAVLTVPGLVHLSYLYWDIFQSVLHEKVTFFSNNHHGLMEHVKNAPRVGRRYVSMALVHLLGGALLLSWLARPLWMRVCAWTIAGVSVLSLALLDARAAYAAIGIGALLLAWALGWRQTSQAIGAFVRCSVLWKLVLAGFLLISVALAHNAGKSRWIALSYSLQAATQHVFHSDVPIAERPYVDAAFWQKPVDDVYRCYFAREFRCRADQSAYLRAAWSLEGIQSLLHHPLGIGYSDNYMGRLWGVEDMDGKYQRVDSFLVEHVVSLGWVAVGLFGWFFWSIIAAMRRAVKSGRRHAALVTVCAILLVCIGRVMVDVLDEGLWKYLMAVAGAYFGLVQSQREHVPGRHTCPT
ncbi:hypothetical protein [Hydrogenophaga sp. BPS33]|uniref:hypothetical protein n=1 Tax=Hydrogenophaga sp. BPS33 TaxID=2651974 RepID=UPI0013201A8E|nr:hypothetical protein [Hydrogenophaga sp. BPS33]QHE83761.1 hypothetical protein F9K07_02125 [Hydrogenophaga sp. BPS33]